MSGLLTWFPEQARDLPWRRTLDPYAVWISEIMLQQTQVKTVIPYWERWMGQLPTVAKLASANPEQILKLWEGLGYYTRARNLQKSAQLIVQRHDGKFPRDFVAVLGLAGVGRYTAGAITSIAFNQPRPILDGNVIRVLTRCFGITAPVRERSTVEQLWHLAETLVETAAKQPGPVSRRRRLKISGACSVLNQALMEVGATICSPRQPRCHDCPLRGECATGGTNRVATIPNLERRPPATARRFLAFLVEHQGKWLVRRRPAGVVNADLWEFPNLEVTALTRQALDPKQQARQALGLTPLAVEPFHSLRHTITRYRIALDSYRVALAGVPSSAKETERWLEPRALDQLAFTSAHRQLLERLLRTAGF